MNLPNQLTLLRIILSFVLILCLLAPGFSAKLAAVFVFAFACLTDLWDGRLARKLSLVSNFGVLMDPIADKILVLSAFVAFVQLGLVPAWMVVVVASREFLITGLRLFALGKGCVLPAEAAGKHKTVSQMVAISITILFIAVRGGLGARASERFVSLGYNGIWWLMLVTVILTLSSGISFLWKHRHLVLVP